MRSRMRSKRCTPPTSARSRRRPPPKLFARSAAPCRSSSRIQPMLDAQSARLAGRSPGGRRARTGDDGAASQDLSCPWRDIWIAARGNARRHAAARRGVQCPGRTGRDGGDCRGARCNRPRRRAFANLNARLQLPTSLAALGFKASDIDRAAELGHRRDLPESSSSLGSRHPRLADSGATKEPSNPRTLEPSTIVPCTHRRASSPRSSPASMRRRMPRGGRCHRNASPWLCRQVSRTRAPRADTPDADRYLSGLHLEDLALAVACIDGHDAAWEHFIADHKSALAARGDGHRSEGRQRARRFALRRALRTAAESRRAAIAIPLFPWTKPAGDMAARDPRAAAHRSAARHEAPRPVAG